MNGRYLTLAGRIRRDLKKFRIRLEAHQISPLIAQLSTTYQNCQTEFLQFADFLEETGTAT